MVDKYEKTVSKIWEITTMISNVFLFVIMMLVVVNVVSRRVFNAPIFGVTEIVCYGSLAAAAFGLSQTEWMDGNVRMTLILERTNAKFGTYLNIILNIIAFAGFSYVSYFLITQAITKFNNGQLSSEIRFPIYIVTGILAIGFVMLTFAILAKLILYILRAATEQYSIAPPSGEPKSEEEIG